MGEMTKMIDESFSETGLLKKNQDIDEYTRNAVTWQNTSVVQEFPNPSGSAELKQLEEIQQRIPYEKLVVIADLLK